MDQENMTDDDVLFVRSLCRRSFEHHSELGNDCFLYVFEKLNEDDYRRIKAYKGRCSFRTFLYSVTSKLIIDFRRNRFGYKVLPKYYWEFDGINRHIFKLFFYQNLTVDWAENAVRSEFKLSQEEAQKRVDIVEKRIRESRLGGKSRIDAHEIHVEEVDSLTSEDKKLGPEEIVIATETLKQKEYFVKVLKEEVQKLDDEDSLILQLYFEQALTAKQISNAIPGLKDKKVYKRVEQTLKKLKKNLEEKGISQEDIKGIFEHLS
jgi:RNA polymerase sigma factor (sigma-70 family)